MKLKAILWDVDGTIVNSEKIHYECLMEFCRQKEINLFYEEEELAGLNLSEILKNVFNEKDVDKISRYIDEIIELYIEKVSRNILIDGIKKLLSFFQSKNIKQVCVSNGERKILNANIIKTGIKKYFEFSLSCEDVANLKPSPIPYLMACAKLNLKKSDVIVIEDSMVGLKSAQTAGIDVIFFSNNRPYPQAVKSNYIARTPAEIKNIINSNYFKK